MTHERSAAVHSAFRLLAGWAGAFARLAETLRPVLRLAEALNGLKAGPAVRGCEPFLIENGTPSFESRLLAVSVDKLRQAQQPGGLIEDIDDELISFVDVKGRGKTARISGLKDRLFRARKKLDRRIEKGESR